MAAATTKRLTNGSDRCRSRGLDRIVQRMELLGQTNTPDGTTMTLTRRTNEYIILADGKSLMSSRMHGSEEALATFACRRLGATERPCVLVDGLDMSYTLRAPLDLLPR